MRKKDIVSQSNFYPRIKTFGNSMYPLLHDGDVLMLEKVCFSEICVDDIVCFRHKHAFVTHRVVYRTKKHLVTRGDGVSRSDGKVFSNQIVGKVVAVERNAVKFSPEDVYLVQSTLYLQELIELIKGLNTHSIEYVFLKGLPLYIKYFGKHPRRIYADVDVLIRKRDYKKASQILKTYGFSLVSRSRKKTVYDDYQVSFVKYVEGFPVVVDLHFELAFVHTNIGRFDEFYPESLLYTLQEKFFNNKQSLWLRDEKYYALSEADQIVYLFIHFFNHNFCGVYRLEILSDLLGEMSKKQSVILEVEDIVKKFRLECYSYPTVLLLKKYFKTRSVSLFSFAKKRNFPLLLRLYTKYFVVSERVFDEASHRGEKFFNLVLFSPSSLRCKMMVFVDGNVLRAIFDRLRLF